MFMMLRPHRTLQSVGGWGRHLSEVAFGGVLAILLTLQPLAPAVTAQSAPPPSPGFRQVYFDCQGFPEYFSVPPGATQLQASSLGGGGGAKGSGGSGLGGVVSGLLNVPVGHVLKITVGCQGAGAQGGYGWARGGDGGGGVWPSGSNNTSEGGGGASAIEDVNGSATGPLMVGGGGGGGGMQGFFTTGDFTGGSGGNGGDQPSGSGAAGLSTGPGAGGLFGACSTSGVGGVASGSGGGGGGGGGAGYNPGGQGNGCGGGGSTGGGSGGGGAGGQSYVDPNFTSQISTQLSPDPTPTNGYVILDYFDDGTVPSPIDTFTCTGSPQVYKVPTGATSLKVTAVGAAGGGDQYGSGGGAGVGGVGTVSFGSGTTQLAVGVGCVGSAGRLGNTSTSDPGGSGGYGYASGGQGGATDELSLGDSTYTGAAGGGGATALGVDANTPMLVAPGGGGWGASGLHGSGGGAGGGGANGAAGNGLGAGGGGAAGGNSTLSGRRGEDGHTGSGGGGGGGGGGGYKGGNNGASGNTGGGGGGGGGGGSAYNLTPISIQDYSLHHPDLNGYLSITPIYAAAVAQPAVAQPAVWIAGATQTAAGGAAISHYNATANAWDTVDGTAATVAVGPDGQPWVVSKLGAVFSRSKGASSYVDGAWQLVANNGTAGSLGVGGK